MTQTAELLLEILCEEIPARMQIQAAETLKELFRKQLADAGLSYGVTSSYVTPRRLVLHGQEISVRQEDRDEERRGPRVGAPEPAIQGFLTSMGLSSLEECQKRASGNGEFWFATKLIKGQETKILLPGMVAKVVESFTWPKSMRWAYNHVRWTRPMQSVLCLFNGSPIEGQLDLGHDQIQYTNETVGHRFHNNKPFTAHDFQSYNQRLLSHRVILNQETRKASIHEQITKLASDQRLKVTRDPGLLEEVTGLVEWPVALMGNIEKQFMELPGEVLITAMRVHQRYFALENEQGHLAPYFITIANIEAIDGGKTIVSGNERVLRARLSDAKFFYEHDKQTPLQKHGQRLHEAIFHADLGTVYEKVERLTQLSEYIASLLDTPIEPVKRAASLAKADLMTGMVGEFPELQGIMGYYYALNDGEREEVAAAIADHYKPKGPSDDLPRSNIGQIISLGDKMDTLVGFFAMGIKPTGSKDPYALRRAALGCIRLLEIMEHLHIDELISKSYQFYQPIFSKSPTPVMPLGDLIEDLQLFFLDRLKVYWREQGLRHDHIEAVFAVAVNEPLAVLARRVHALDDFLKQPDGDQLLTAYRRACNIVRIEEKRENVTFDHNVNTTLLQAGPENKLYRVLNESMSPIRASLEDNDFQKAMGYVAKLRPYIDEFFDKVTVNTDDPSIRANRLRLLSLIRGTLHQVADFSKIEG